MKNKIMIELKISENAYTTMTKAKNNNSINKGTSKYVEKTHISVFLSFTGLIFY